MVDGVCPDGDLSRVLLWLQWLQWPCLTLIRIICRQKMDDWIAKNHHFNANTQSNSLTKQHIAKQNPPCLIENIQTHQTCTSAVERMPDLPVKNNRYKLCDNTDAAVARRNLGPPFYDAWTYLTMVRPFSRHHHHHHKDLHDGLSTLTTFARRGCKGGHQSAVKRWNSCPAVEGDPLHVA